MEKEKLLSSSLGLIAIMAITILAMSANTSAAQGNSCKSPEFDMSPCMDFVNGDELAPSDACCSRFGKIVADAPECLCPVKSENGGRASKLPEICKVSMPPTEVICNPGKKPKPEPEPDCPPHGLPLPPPFLPHPPPAPEVRPPPPPSPSGAPMRTSTCIMALMSWIISSHFLGALLTT